MAGQTSFTMRIAHRGGVRAALDALASALRTARTPRAASDDVRLAVELVLSSAATRAPDRELVLGVAARPGGVAAEMRVPRGTDVDVVSLGPLVDECDVRRETHDVVVGVRRAWLEQG